MEKNNLQLPLKYDQVDPEEIIARLKAILNYLIRKNNEEKLKIKNCN